MDGAFFSHPDFQVPEKEMGHHARLYMVMPAHKFSDLIMIHSQLCFGFFKALFYGPPQATQPDKFFQPGADRRIGDEI